MMQPKFRKLLSYALRFLGLILIYIIATWLLAIILDKPAAGWDKLLIDGLIFAAAFTTANLLLDKIEHFRRTRKQNGNH